MRQLLKIVTVKTTLGELAKYVSEFERQDHAFNRLPKYTNNNVERFSEARDCLQFCTNVELIDADRLDDEIILFNMEPISNLLYEEVSQCGIEYLFEDHYEELMKCIKESSYNNLEEYYGNIPADDFIELNFEFVGTGEDTELDLEVKGLL